MRNASHIRLEIPSEPQYISVVRQAIGGIAARMRFDPMEVADVKLAVGEACTNAIRHGCVSSLHPQIIITCRVSTRSLEIEISNGLEGGEPCPTIVSRPDSSKEGGMGLFIIKRIMDEFDIIWSDDIAKVRMVKNLKSCANAK